MEDSKSWKMIAGLGVFVRGVAPHVVIAVAAARGGPAGPLEPEMLVGGVIDHQFGDDSQAPVFGLPEEGLEIAAGAVIRVDAGVVGDVVAVVLERRGVKRQEPDGGYPQVLQIIQLGGDPAEIADAVPVAVKKSADVHLVDNGVLVPQGVASRQGPTVFSCQWPLP